MTDSDYNLKKQPLQARSVATVGFIKEAATRILKEQGLANFTTNHVAERAGVSIGSLYQYFPTKNALIAEIKRDHFAKLRDLIKSAYITNQHKPLEDIVAAFIKASIDAHLIDPELHRILSGDLSDFKIKEDDQHDTSVRSTVEQLLAKSKHELRSNLNIPLAAKLLYKVVETMTHDIVLNSPEMLDEEHYLDEIKRMVMAYLR